MSKIIPLSSYIYISYKWCHMTSFILKIWGKILKIWEYSCVTQTLNHFSESVDKSRRPGIATFYKLEIDRILSEEMWKQPKAILNILTKRKMDNVPGYEIPLPELRQIRNYKRNTNTPHNNEYEEVLRKINELSSLSLLLMVGLIRMDSYISLALQ